MYARRPVVPPAIVLRLSQPIDFDDPDLAAECYIQLWHWYSMLFSAVVSRYTCAAATLDMQQHMYSRAWTVVPVYGKASYSARHHCKLLAQHYAQSRIDLRHDDDDDDDVRHHDCTLSSSSSCYQSSHSINAIDCMIAHCRVILLAC
jgi:hypothetical protein